MLFDCFTFGSEADPKPFRSSQRKFPEEIEVKFGKTTWKVEHHCNAQKNYGKLPLVCTETSNECRRVLLCGTKKKCSCRREKGAESEVPVASTTPGSQHANGVANLCTRQMQTSRTEIMQAFPKF